MKKIIYFVLFIQDPCDLGWRPYVLSWMKTLPNTVSKPKLLIIIIYLMLLNLHEQECMNEQRRDYLLQLFELSIDEGIKFLEENKFELTSPVPALSAVKTLCQIVLGLFNFISEEAGSREGNKHEAEANESSSSISRKSVTGVYIPKRKLVKTRSQIRLEQSLPRSPRKQRRYTPSCDSVCEVLGKLFVFAFTWSFGGCFETSGTEEEDCEQTSNIFRGGSTARQNFDALVHRIFSGSRDSNVQVQLPPTSDLIYSYYVDFNSGLFKPWKTLVPSNKQIITQLNLKQKGFENIYQQSPLHFLDSDSVMGKLYRANTMGMVPTVDSVRLCFLIILLLQHNSTHYNNVLVAGKTGVGKTQLLKHVSNILQNSKCCKDILSCAFPIRKPPLTNLGSSSQNATPLHSTEPNAEQEDVSLLCHVSPHMKASKLQSTIEHQLVRKVGNVLSLSSERKV